MVLVILNVLTFKKSLKKLMEFNFPFSNIVAVGMNADAKCIFRDNEYEKIDRKSNSGQFIILR